LERLLPQAIETDPEKRARAEAARRAMARDAYIRECSKRFEKTLEGTRAAILEGKKKVLDLQGQLTRAIREVRGVERKLEQLSACRGGELEKYGEEFDRLLDVPNVRRVEAKEGKVIIFTNTLYCVDPRSQTRHEIGVFRIEMNSANSDVRWFNLTRRVGDHFAPHVKTDGSACLGNTAEIFAELIGSYEFAAAAMVAIQFVESCNVDDVWGKTISQWPVAAA
jgi:hypothetical protein